MTCKVCGNTADNTRYEAREMMYGLRTLFTYFECAVCKCLQIENIPADIANYYPNDYNGFARPREKDYRGLKGAFKKMRHEAALFPEGIFSQLFGTLFSAPQFDALSKVGLNRGTKILDMGGGTGTYLYPLYQLGMKNVMTADPFIPADITYPNGYKVVKSYIHQIQGTWDVIIYNHSFEHVPDPLENLQSVAQLLAPGGTCIIRIPTVSSYAWKHYRTNWFQLDAPRHFFLHSVESMTILARKAGLEVTAVRYDSTASQFISSEQYLKNIPLQEQRSRTLGAFFNRKLNKWKYGRQAKKLNAENRGDQAAFFLKRAW